MNLVVFLQIPRNVKCPTSTIDCEANFIDLGIFCFKVIVFFSGKSISGIYSVPRARRPPGRGPVAFLLTNVHWRGRASPQVSYETAMQ